ncbi:MAG TPA: RidA family protein [Jiangellaceae bacterium]|nr:RidA family protein [Jiangellaceae bacterium]
MTGGHDLVNPADLPRPSGFNHAVVSGAGRAVWLAGQTALDADGRVVALDDVVAQFEQALRNLLTVLGTAGGHPEHLVSMTVFCVDIEDYRTHSQRIGQVWRRLVGTYYPAMAVVEINRLWDAEALVELQGIAVVGGPPDE